MSIAKRLNYKYLTEGLSKSEEKYFQPKRINQLKVKKSKDKSCIDCLHKLTGNCDEYTNGGFCELYYNIESKHGRHYPAESKTLFN